MKRLTEYLDAVAPFDWHGNNCAHFVLGWAGRKREMPKGLKEARRLHGANWPAAMSKALGVEPLEHPMLAQVGDVVALPCAGKPRRVIFGINNGPWNAVLSSQGVVYTSAQPLFAWRPQQ